MLNWESRLSNTVNLFHKDIIFTTEDFVIPGKTKLWLLETLSGFCESLWFFCSFVSIRGLLVLSSEGLEMISGSLQELSDLLSVFSGIPSFCTVFLSR